MRASRETTVTVAGKRRLIGRGGTPRAAVVREFDALHVPGEKVLLLAVDLPLANPRKRLEALPFAVEDRIAAPIEAVHLALGGEITPRRYLVAVVSHVVMEGWLAEPGEVERPNAALVPDMLTLPLPAPGEWAIDLRGPRALVRAGDGTGLALPAGALSTAWVAAGKPAFVSLGEPLPPEFGPATGSITGIAGPMVDLRQGRYTARTARLAAPLRRAAIVLAIGLCGHLAMLIADTLALQSIADARRNETRGLVAAAAPGRWGGDDIMTVAMDLLPRDGDRGSGQLLPLLGRASIGLASLPPGVALRTLRFDAAGGTLMLDVDAPQAALIDRAARALGARPTPPIIEGGLARATLTLRDGPAT